MENLGRSPVCLGCDQILQPLLSIVSLGCAVDCVLRRLTQSPKSGLRSRKRCGWC